jgi:hypothetical protein
MMKIQDLAHRADTPERPGAKSSEIGAILSYSSRTVTTKLAALLLCVATAASADSKSWSVIKAKVGGSPQLIVSLDFEAMRKAGTFAGVLEALTADPQPTAVLAMVKASCQFDPTAVVSDLTFAFGKDDFVLALGFTGVDQTKVVDCATKVVASQKAKLTVGSVGKVTTYAVDGKEIVAGSWVAKDTFVLSSQVMGGRPDDSHAAMEAFLAGKPVTGEIASYLAKADLTKPVWFAAAAPNKDVVGAYGAVSFTSTGVAGTAKIVTKSKDVAAKIVGDAKDKISRRVKSAKDPAVAKVLNAVKVGATTADVDVSFTVTDKETKAVFNAFDVMF